MAVEKLDPLYRYPYAEIKKDELSDEYAELPDELVVTTLNLYVCAIVRSDVVCEVVVDPTIVAV